MTLLVVTGTGTGVGKTVVTAALAALALERGSAVAVVKAAQTGVAPGEPGDLDEVCRLSGLDRDHTFTCGVFEPALSPAAAARASGVPPVPYESMVGVALMAEATHSLVLVEGAGGLLVRYDEDGATIADLARDLQAPVLVVTRADLGTLNHTALTLEALAHRGLELGGVVVGAWPAAPGPAERSNVADLETLAARPLAGVLPDGASALTQPDFLAAARAGLAPAYGGRFDATAFRKEQQ